jgi:hypothetical protein
MKVSGTEPDTEQGKRYRRGGAGSSHINLREQHVLVFRKVIYFDICESHQVQKRSVMVDGHHINF